MTISQKFSLSIISILMVIAVTAIVFFYFFETSRETEKLELFATMTGRVIEESLATYMLNRNIPAMKERMSNITKNTESVSRLWLINNEGVVKAGTEPHIAGPVLSFDDSRCLRCHEKRKKGIFLEPDNVFRWSHPVRNKPECHTCHNPGMEYNGVIIIDFSSEEIKAHITTEILGGSFIIFTAIALIGVGIFFLSRTMVGRRLGKVTRLISRFKDGDFTVRIPLQGNDEITRLEDSFNRMADTINERDREKDILFKNIVNSQQMWRDTFDGIGDLISIHDRDFNIIKANRAFAEYFGLDPKNVINRKCYELFHKGDSAVMNCPHRITMQENRPATSEVADTESKKIFLVSTFPFHFHDTDLYGSIHIAKDITEEREREMRLIMTERLASLGQMASGIAHEINNPLAAIAGCAEGLHNRVKKGKYEPDLFDNYLKIIEEEIARCKGITTSMLSFVRKSTYEKKEVNINEAIEKAIEIIGFQGRFKEVAVTKDYAEGLPLVNGNDGELRQVFMAVITNALDAMDNRGTLTIRTGTMPHPTGAEGSREIAVFAEIKDTGPGIAVESLTRIFDPFFTTKSDKGGTGLGLSIASKIISNHNGSIQAASEEGKGATFTVVLPAGRTPSP